MKAGLRVQISIITRKPIWIRRSTKSKLVSALCCLESLHHHAYWQKGLRWIGRSNSFGLGRSPRLFHDLLPRRLTPCVLLALPRYDEHSVCAARHLLRRGSVVEKGEIALKGAVGNALPLPRCFRPPMICADLEGCEDVREHGNTMTNKKLQRGQRGQQDAHKGYCEADSYPQGRWGILAMQDRAWRLHPLRWRARPRDGKYRPAPHILSGIARIGFIA